jgi:hypothetical protein
MGTEQTGKVPTGIIHSYIVDETLTVVWRVTSSPGGLSSAMAIELTGNITNNIMNAKIALMNPITLLIPLKNIMFD